MDNPESLTKDVLPDEPGADFSSLMLNPCLLKGLNKMGYHTPSPIQIKGIPVGKLGIDMIAQAKSGTGKTCVFSVISIEHVLNSVSSFSSLFHHEDQSDQSAPSVLIIAPTREIAIQIHNTLESLSTFMKDRVKSNVFIGGMPVEEDKRKFNHFFHIAVGTPGRIKSLMCEAKLIKPEKITLLVLDEADKLFEKGVFRTQMETILESLRPKNEQNMNTFQFLAFSATFPEEIKKILYSNMKKEPQPKEINLIPPKEPTLIGVKQYFTQIDAQTLQNSQKFSSSLLEGVEIFNSKKERLLLVLKSVMFLQGIIFCCNTTRVENIVNFLKENGFSAENISGDMPQENRNAVMEKIRNFEIRLVVSTDLIARGVDLSRVNLVVNLDMPNNYNKETYLHRTGRTGRFGSQGIAVSIVTEREQNQMFEALGDEISKRIGSFEECIEGIKKFRPVFSDSDAKKLNILSKPIENSEESTQNEVNNEETNKKKRKRDEKIEEKPENEIEIQKESEEDEKPQEKQKKSKKKKRKTSRIDEIEIDFNGFEPPIPDDEEQ